MAGKVMIGHTLVEIDGDVITVSETWGARTPRPIAVVRLVSDGIEPEASFMRGIRLGKERKVLWRKVVTDAFGGDARDQDFLHKFYDIYHREPPSYVEPKEDAYRLYLKCVLVGRVKMYGIGKVRLRKYEEAARRTGFLPRPG